MARRWKLYRWQLSSMIRRNKRLRLAIQGLTIQPILYAVPVQIAFARSRHLIVDPLLCIAEQTMTVLQMMQLEMVHRQQQINRRAPHNRPLVREDARFLGPFQGMLEITKSIRRETFAET